MNEKDDVKREDNGACAPGCACGSAGSGGRGRMVIGVVVVIVVCALVARAIVKSQGSAGEKQAATGFSAMPVSEPADEQAVTTALDETSAEQAVANELAELAVTNALKEISAIMELNQLAMDSRGVFIYVDAKGPSDSKLPMDSMLGAARKIESQAGGKIGMFTLKVGSPDYEMISAQVSVPSVIVLVPGGRMVPVMGEITEPKLIQGFLSSVQSCGAGGCGPRSGC